MPKQDPFGNVENYAVIIPYRDFVKIAEMAQNIENIELMCRRMTDQYGAMKQMYREMLDKIGEINRML